MLSNMYIYRYSYTNIIMVVCFILDDECSSIKNQLSWAGEKCDDKAKN